jgi:hypothetical protein
MEIFWPPFLRRAGFGLFVCSFLPWTPGDLPSGFSLLIATPGICYAFVSAGHLREFFLGLVLFAAWVGNSLIFFRFRNRVRYALAALPWLFFISCVLIPVQLWDTHDTTRFVVLLFPFYPWAIGIGLVHLGNSLWRPPPSWNAYKHGSRFLTP